MFFPRLILPLSTLFAVVLDFGVAFLVLAVLLVTNDLLPGPTILLLPVWLGLILLLGQGLGVFFAALSVRYRDIPHIIPVVLQMLLYASPVAYSVAAVPDRYLNLFYLNPLASLLQALRWSLFDTPFPPARWLAWSAAAALIVFALGLLYVEKTERTFADVI